MARPRGVNWSIYRNNDKSACQSEYVLEVIRRSEYIVLKIMYGMKKMMMEYNYCDSI